MPNTQNLHIDRALTNISVGYKNEDYIADQVFKAVGVAKRSDKYYVFGKEAFVQNDDARAPGAESNEINWKLSADAYFCDGHALKTPIAVEDYANADDSFELEADGTELVTEGILLNKEINASEKLLDSSNYNSDLVYNLGSGGDPAKWSDFIASPDSYESDPVRDISNAKTAIHKKSGLKPNALIVSESVYNVLKIHPKILGIFTGVAAVSIASKEQVKMALGVDNLIIGSALKASAGISAGDDMNYIWGNSAILAYVPNKPGKKIPAIGYSFTWNRSIDGGVAENGVAVRKYYSDARQSTIIEAEKWYDQKIISNTAGFLFADAVV